MDQVSEIKQYHLSPEAIETLLQTKFGTDIKPIDYNLLQKQRTQQQRQATLAANILEKDKLEEEPGEEDPLEGLEEIESL
jgi:hypothetical protein